MAHAETCPVCQGKGNLPDCTSKQRKTCHGCNGLGWITIQDIIPIPYSPIKPKISRPISPWYLHG